MSDWSRAAGRRGRTRRVRRRPGSERRGWRPACPLERRARVTPDTIVFNFSGHQQHRRRRLGRLRALLNHDSSGHRGRHRAAAGSVKKPGSRSSRTSGHCHGSKASSLDRGGHDGTSAKCWTRHACRWPTKRKLLASVERGEWKSASGGKRGRTRYARYAKATFRKDRRLNIRLSSKDLEAIQKRAIAEGLPYQTLISSLLYKYAAGRLKEV
jgi:predicted DNA binding CopG/RHH family protein